MPFLYTARLYTLLLTLIAYSISADRSLGFSIYISLSFTKFFKPLQKAYYSSLSPQSNQFQSCLNLVIYIVTNFSQRSFLSFYIAYSSLSYSLNILRNSFQNAFYKLSVYAISIRIRVRLAKQLSIIGYIYLVGLSLRCMLVAIIFTILLYTLQYKKYSSIFIRNSQAIPFLLLYFLIIGLFTLGYSILVGKVSNTSPPISQLSISVVSFFSS